MLLDKVSGWGGGEETRPLADGAVRFDFGLTRLSELSTVQATGDEEIGWLNGGQLEGCYRAIDSSLRPWAFLGCGVLLWLDSLLAMSV